MTLSASDVRMRVDLDPRAGPAIYRMKFSDGVFLDYPVHYIGYRNPTDEETLIMTSVFADKESGIFNLWAFELLAAPSHDDHFIQDGIEWILEKVMSKLFHTRYRCLCIKCVGQRPNLF